ncbi:MAG: ATP-dependent helicase, partial [Planctomycetaceae bacterium]
MDPLAALNPAQRDAVTTLSGPLLVLAGAGTGKTRVITHRIAELIRRGTRPERVLSVTFTNKAAREMRQRVAALLDRRRETKPVISTFHAYCVRVLRQEIASLGYPPQFTIYDRGDQESAARTALRDVRVSDKTMRPGDLLNVVSRWKMSGVPPERAADVSENDRDFLAAVAYRKYQQNLRAAGAVDFDDLLLLTNRLFAECPDVLARQQSRFDHVQIDEYQDTNGTQFQLVKSLVKRHHNLCVVGDDDQSIYAWRGADVTHILHFGSQFPGTKTVRLQNNYRCTDRILAIANRLATHNPHRHDKALVAEKRATSDVRFREFPDEQAEAENVVREIKYLTTQQHVPPADFAVLFRTNEQPRIFETEFRRAGLRYVLLGSQSFFDRKEVRDVLAYLKFLAQPSDEMSLLRIINTPARGIGRSTVEKLLERAVRRKQSLWDAIPDAAAAGDI